MRFDSTAGQKRAYLEFGGGHHIRRLLRELPPLDPPDVSLHVSISEPDAFDKAWLSILILRETFFSGMSSEETHGWSMACEAMLRLGRKRQNFSLMQAPQGSQNNVGKRHVRDTRSKFPFSITTPNFHAVNYRPRPYERPGKRNQQIVSCSRRSKAGGNSTGT